VLSPSISYDADGNLLNDTFHAYTWDAYGHISSIDSTTCGTNGTCLTYDALGNMVEKSVNSVYTEVLFSPVGKTAIMSGQTTSSAYFPLPAGETLYESGSTGGNQYLWHKDWLGSVRFASTLGGRASYFDRAFAPFGEPYNNFGNTSGNSFTGDTQDTISGTYDTPNRELNPNQGRWISPDPDGLVAVDPSNPQTWNRYVYVANYPLNVIDPAGTLMLISSNPGGGDDPPGGGFDGGSWACDFFGLFCSGPAQPPMAPCIYVLRNPCGQNPTTAANTWVKPCSVAVECGNTLTPHCGITVGEQNGTYTQYDGEPSTNSLSQLMNPFSDVTLTVQVLPNSPPPGGPGGGNIIFQSPVSCSGANCIQKSADYTNAAGLPYSAIGIRGENSNWWASTTTRVCGLSVNYPSNAIGTVP